MPSEDDREGAAGRELETLGRDPEPTTPPKRSSRKGSFILLVVSLLLCGLILEVAVRLLLPPLDNAEMKVFDAEIGKTLRPGYVGTDLGVEVRINAHGLRSPEFSLEKPEGTYRILVLGDSWTFGVGVQQDETYPVQLERILNERFPDRKTEVLNAGVSGYETYNEAVYFRRTGCKFQPDLVLIGFYPVNDLHDKKSKYERYARERVEHPVWHFIRRFPKVHLRSYQYFGYMRSSLKRSYRRWRSDASNFDAGSEELDEDYFVEWTSLYRDDFQGWNTAKKSLADIAGLAEENGARVVLAVFPDIRSLEAYRRFLKEKFYPQLEKTALDLGIRVVDMAPALYAYEGKEDEIALYGRKEIAHPNAKGYRLLAEYLADIIGGHHTHFP